ncbi:hypothetical protein RFI_05665 [Reticulomyxa filosa]|uniref:Uncharacterized protein n=1 Tax=Reticulomyxa filosa TaxID=46433 RepID=X6NYS6_RETFI|nr:hypothetical protein RFI_05665 [Reticulomyxa filosa]|eukprot:ETO31455.1 hypothetical protein RFI_05665 [Reticulomyxa filosa]
MYIHIEQINMLDMPIVGLKLLEPIANGLDEKSLFYFERKKRKKYECKIQVESELVIDLNNVIMLKNEFEEVVEILLLFFFLEGETHYFIRTFWIELLLDFWIVRHSSTSDFGKDGVVKGEIKKND